MKVLPVRKTTVHPVVLGSFTVSDRWLQLKAMLLHVGVHLLKSPMTRMFAVSEHPLETNETLAR